MMICSRVDAIQLASAILAAQHQPVSLPFVTVEAYFFAYFNVTSDIRSPFRKSTMTTKS